MINCPLPKVRAKIFTQVQGVLALCNFWDWEKFASEKIALGKYLANAIFGQFISLLQFDFGFWAILFH